MRDAHVVGQVALQRGLPAALDELHAVACPELLPGGPGCHVLVTPGILDRVGTPATGTVRLETPDGALCWGVVASAGEPDDPWRLGLAHVRLGASRRLREQAQRYLSARTVGGTPLLLQQMVKGSLADALGRQIEAETVLSGAVPGALSQATLRHVHETITETDRELLRLLGASGFRLDGPGVTAHASALLADAYLDRPTVRS